MNEVVSEVINDSSSKLLSGTDEHYTPAEIIEAARSTMGEIELDPASCEMANLRLVKAARYFSEPQNGFTKTWRSPAVFLNPPGGRCDSQGRQCVLIRGEGWHVTETGEKAKGIRSSATAWWHKLCDEYHAGNVKQAVFIGFTVELMQKTQEPRKDKSPDLLPMAWADAICFPKKRIRFMVADGLNVAEESSPTHANVIAYLGPNASAFVRYFATIGASGKLVTTKKGRNLT